MAGECGWSNGRGEALPPSHNPGTKYPPPVFRDTGYSSNLDHFFLSLCPPKQPACGEKNLEQLNLIGNKSRPRVWDHWPLVGSYPALLTNSCPGWKPRGQACFVWGGVWGVRIAKAAKYDFFSCNFVSLSCSGDWAADNSEDLVLMIFCFCVIIICSCVIGCLDLCWPVWINRKLCQCFPWKAEAKLSGH